ncbi:MAG: DNA-deoxyinosine glycosylase [Oscillospiraceae bacterium]|nr:DNA-deoxyinosine glycosylase [Oscillospiraceae bacterium]MDD4368386.1 DNA-deoxyinosine glycosylase [Oscillospiraceae bacterium]
MDSSVHLDHPLAPVYNAASQILILGSFPSVRSRQSGFYYGHPQNRFWPLLARLLQEARPETIPEKQALLLRHRIALWDTLASCSIKGSRDNSIQDAVPCDLQPILRQAAIRQIFVNGRAAARFYQRYQQPITGLTAVTLPSTSPANAAWSLDRLYEAWRVILRYL